MEIKSALIVDDSKMARVVLKKHLENRDVAVQMVASGEESIEYLKNNQPDIIFMDCLMPGQDGFETTRQIRRDPNYSEIPIVMCTGKESVEDRKKAFEFGAAAYMCKSSSPESLQKILDEFDKQEMQLMSSELKLLQDENQQLKDSRQALIDSINSFDINKLSELSERIATEIATEISKSAAHDISMANISSFSSEFNAGLNKKLSLLSEQLEEKVIFSIKSSLNNIHGYIDDKMSFTDKNLKDEFNNSIKIAIEEFKSEQNDGQLKRLIHEIAEQQVHESLESSLTAYATVLLDHEVTHKLIKSVVDEQLETQNKKMNELKALLASKNKSQGKILNIISLSLAAAALGISLFLLLKVYL